MQNLNTPSTSNGMVSLMAFKREDLTLKVCHHYSLLLVDEHSLKFNDSDMRSLGDLPIEGKSYTQMYFTSCSI